MLVRGKSRGETFTVDASGDVYLSDQFTFTGDFNPVVGVANLTYVGAEDIFILELNASGNLQWVKQIGETQEDKIHGISVDLNGNIFTSGYFDGTADFDPEATTSNLIFL